MKLKLLYLLLIGSLLGSLTLTYAQDGIVTLEVWHQFNEGQDAVTWQTIKERFEAANPNIRIVDTPYQAEDLLTALTVALPAGQGPDITYLDASSAFLGALIESNLAVNLTSHFAERSWDERMFEWAQEKTTYNGNLYGVGGFAEIVGIYYRADLFEELGLEPPSTWDAMIGAADRALEEGILPFSLGALEGWPYSHLCGVMLHAILPLDTIFEIETLEGSGTYNDYPESLEAIEECQHWAEQRYFPTDMTGVTYVDSRNDFITGVGLMRIDGSWAIPELQTTQLDINFVPFPMKNPELPLQNEGGISSTWVVLEGVVDLDAALDFLDYVVFDEEVNELWMQGGLIPSVSFDTANIEAHPFVIQNLEAIEYISTEGDGLGYWVVFAADPSYSDASIAGWQALLLNQITPQQLSDMLSEAMLEARRLRQ